MKRSVVVRILKITVSVLLVGFLLSRIGIGRIFDQMSQLRTGWFAVALLVFLASHLLGSVQWWLLLRSEDLRIPFWSTVRYYFIGLFFNNFLIGGVGGDVIRMLDVRRVSKNGTAAVSTVFLDRLAGFLVLTGMSVAAAVVVAAIRREQIPFHGILGFLAGSWIFITAFFFSKRFARPFAWVIRKILPRSLSARARDVYVSIHRFGRKGKLFGQVLGISVVVQSLRIMTHCVLGWSIGVVLSPVAYFLLIPVVATVSSLPISIGGLGVREQCGVILFGFFAVNPSQAFSIEFLAYCVAIASSLPGGIAFVCHRGVFEGKSKSRSDV